MINEKRERLQNFMKDITQLEEQSLLQLQFAANVLLARDKKAILDVTHLWDIPDDTSYMDGLDDAVELLKGYANWRFEGEIVAMELRCFSLDLPDGSKIIAEEHTYSQEGKSGFNVMFFHVTSKTKHPHDGFTTEKTLAEYIAELMKRKK